jgi:hypothetical protein
MNGKERLIIGYDDAVQRYSVRIVEGQEAKTVLIKGQNLGAPVQHTPSQEIAARWDGLCVNMNQLALVERFESLRPRCEEF